MNIESLSRHMMSIRHVVCFALALSPLGIAPSVMAQGTPLDSILVVDENGQPIPFANLSIKGGIPAVANALGVFTFRNSGDTLAVLVRRIGFESYQGKIGRSAGSAVYRVTLTRAAQTLNKVSVSETMSAEPLRRNGFYDRMMEVKKGAQIGEFFTPEDLQARQTVKISDFLFASRYAKVQQTTTMYVNGQQHSGRSRRFLQGRAGCPITLLVDGVVMHNMLGDMRDANGSEAKAFGDDRTTLDEVVSGPDVMAIEVYPSNSSAPMSMASRVLGSSCGIVAIWTGAR